MRSMPIARCVLALSATLTLLPSVTFGQEQICKFTHPVQTVSLENLPPLLRNALIKDHMIADPPNQSTGGPNFVYAGQVNKFYFVWSYVGDIISTRSTSLYRMDSSGGAPVLVKRVSAQFANYARWCESTDEILENYANEPGR